MTDPTTPARLEPVAPTQILHPWRASIRTAAQTALAVLLALVAALPLVQDFVETVAPGSPIVGWVAGATSIAAALAGLLTRVMALEPVNALLERLGLGPAPRGY